MMRWSDRYKSERSPLDDERLTTAACALFIAGLLAAVMWGIFL